MSFSFFRSDSGGLGAIYSDAKRMSSAPEFPDLSGQELTRNPWFSGEKKVAFEPNGPHGPSSGQLGEIFDLHTGAEAMRNKSTQG